ncbi:hypothetical protein M3C58_00480 [Brachybacterium muris]|uniref:DUF6912 family protein n=1 Tax=Brachybacterium muris TaxID=219301 RepID=UPI00195CB0CD|nr:hypothetical protein [Brachybacterium muris]MBM7501265.1 Iap family predicted aminopeptidase [Brachybacterium muris]MCT1429900.1 hypothetical protein [Brachybacterium muris]MCT1653649.1 hypothetical protein [Brachybacterium muris]MCT1996694.1 hypothetical protein [Brachybacterium muris]MCT2176650.1 hypothetical protein [Brachybacterium muris]
MRIYLPLADEDRPALLSARREIDLPAGREAWAVTAEARADRPGEDIEDLEYDAVQDAVHVALQAVEPDARALVMAADVADKALEGATSTGGAYGVRLVSGARAVIASFHVTEQDARTAEQDDTDPALLWFDASEGPSALAQLDRPGV